ncbi:MAG: Lrp/AsnC family transcriptional regulator [Fervidicoccaceae archaeon]
MSERSDSSPLRLDEKDLELLELLKRNSRISYRELAERLGVSKTAVKKRVDKLVGSGIIKRFTIEYEIAQKVKAVVLLKVLPGYDVPAVAKKIAELDMADQVYEVAGEYDVVVVASTPSIQTINKLVDSLRRTEGVASTNTLIVLRAW